MLKQLKKQDKGFTIIEVMIVLAIAGLIMLIVFLAVPALQRNSRNTQRNNDAGLVAAAVNECINNRNGQTASCDTTAEINVDTTKLQQLTTVTVAASTAAQPASGTTSVGVWWGHNCNTDGSAAQGATAREFAVLYSTESGASGTATRCVSS